MNPQVDYDLPEWLKPTEEERVQMLLEAEQYFDPQLRRELMDRIEGPQLPPQPTPALSTTYNQINQTASVEGRLLSRAVVTRGMDIHHSRFGQPQFEKLLEAIKKQPDENFHTFGWEAKLAGEDIGLPFGKSYSVVLEDEPNQVSSSLRAAHLINSTTQLYADLYMNGYTQRQLTLKKLDQGRTNLEVRGYDRLFGMRRAGEDADTVKLANKSNYIVVTTSYGRMYQLQVIDEKGPIPSEDLQANIDEIIELDKHIIQEIEGDLANGRPKYPKSYAPLTYMNRRKLHEVTKDIAKNVNNRKMLSILNNALFTVSLDTQSEPVDDSETAQLTQYGSLIKEGEMKYMNMNTVQEAGLTFTVFKNGKAGAKAEHLLIDGNEFVNATNYINNTSLNSKPSTEFHSTKDVPRRFVNMDWRIPPKYFEAARQYYLEEVNKRDILTISLEGVGIDVFGREWADPAVQVAVNLAYSDIRSLMGFGTSLEDITSFYCIEPVHMRDFRKGRVINPVVSGEALKEFMKEIRVNPASRNLPKMLESSLKSVKASVRAAKVKGEAYLSQLMTLTAIEKYDRKRPAESFVEAAKYMRGLEHLFHLASGKPMKKFSQAELLGSNGGRGSKITGIRSFCTVESLSMNGITVGEILGDAQNPSVFTIRASGDAKPYARQYAAALEKRLRDVRNLFLQIDKTSIGAGSSHQSLSTLHMRLGQAMPKI